MIATNPTVQSPRFALGQTVATPGALQALAAAGQEASTFITRHVCGDWGQICEEDRQANEQAVSTGERLLSAYTLRTGVKIWIITEADRSSTCVLLPEDY